MFKKIFSPGPFTTFYAVFAYIIAFALWWAYLLYAKNETAYKEKIQLNEIAYRQSNPNQSYLTTDDFRLVHEKYRRQRIMIMGEGTAFILLLVFGLLRVRKVFLREMELIEQQRNFLLSITHELKSPLSTVKLSLQTMAKRKLEPEKTEKLIVNSLVDLDRLEGLVDNILFAAKIERDEPGFADDEVSISEIVQMVVDRFIGNKKKIAIHANLKQDIYMHSDAIGLTSVVINLVENAIKYSDEGTQIKIDLSDNENNVYLNVADEGMGIPDEEKKKVFEKFYRVGNEDTRRTKGTGLGLYIIHRFIKIYQGSIAIEDNSPRGTIFRIVIPKHTF